jgi:hypothetical protein
LRLSSFRVLRAGPSSLPANWSQTLKTKIDGRNKKQHEKQGKRVAHDATRSGAATGQRWQPRGAVSACVMHAIDSKAGFVHRRSNGCGNPIGDVRAA